MAHKKAAGSAKNLRDSNPKYRGVKVFWWQSVVAWNIIIRQKWNKYEEWDNTYLAKDFSIHASIDGIVSFSKKNKLRFDWRRYLKTVVHVLPFDSIKLSEKSVEKEVKKETKKEVKKESPAKKPAATKKPAAKKPTTAKKPTVKKTTTK